MIPKFINKDSLPHKSGVYIFKDSLGAVLYVGKAIDLYSRVSSYFSGPQNLKTTQLVEKIASLDTIIVESEIEALILEANLIKKYLPNFNVRLTDDKDYLYIKITNEKFPRVITARKQDLGSSRKYFGPFPSSTTVKKTLKSLRKVFPWCLTGKFKIQNSKFKDKTRQRPCFYYHLGLCPGPCAGVIDQTGYLRIIKRFVKFMEGKKRELVDDLNKEMKSSAKRLDFEKAQTIKKTVLGIEYLTSPNKLQNYLENPNFLEDINKSSLEQLQKDLELPELPIRIECFDISNIQGKDATGSMVVLTNGDIDKSQYRRFKIRISGKPNDYAMHAEVARRRLNHPEWGIPELILIDGGRGQVRAVKEAIESRIKNLESRTIKNKVTINQFSTLPVLGLAKKMEWLYPPEGEVIKLPKRSLSLRILQKARDEAHRFAISYHRKLRLKSSGIR